MSPGPHKRKEKSKVSLISKLIISVPQGFQCGGDSTWPHALESQLPALSGVKMIRYNFWCWHSAIPQAGWLIPLLVERVLGLSGKIVLMTASLPVAEDLGPGVDSVNIQIVLGHLSSLHFSRREAGET